MSTRSRRVLSCALTCLVACYALQAAVAAPSTPRVPPRTTDRDTLHVLLIGNSYLYYNNAPRMLEAIAEHSDGPVIRTRLIAHGGWTLGDHWSDTATQAAVAERRWDWIVLQEQSTLGDAYFVNGIARVHDARQFAEAATHFGRTAQAARSRLAIVAHWGARAAPTRDLDALRFIFDSTSRATGAVIVPVGEAWADASLRNERARLYDSDGSHPSARGSYLLASVLYSALTRRRTLTATTVVRGAFIEPDEGVVRPDSEITLVRLPKADAARFSRVAWDVTARARASHKAGRVPRPALIAVPQLPTRGESIGQAALVGTWRGTTTVYPVSPPATIELRVLAAGDSVHAELRRMTRPSAPTAYAPVALAVRDSMITITDPDGPNGGRVVYRGRLQSGVLRGVVEFMIPTPGLYGVGRWSLARER